MFPTETFRTLILRNQHSGFDPKTTKLISAEFISKNKCENKFLEMCYFEEKTAPSLRKNCIKLQNSLRFFFFAKFNTF